MIADYHINIKTGYKIVCLDSYW